MDVHRHDRGDMRADRLAPQGGVGGIAVEQAFLAALHAEVLDTIFNDWLLRKFRANLERMDRENSLELMLGDLEEIVTPPPAAPSSPVPSAA